MTFDQFSIPFQKLLKVYGEDMVASRMKEIYQKFERHDAGLVTQVLEYIGDLDSYFPKNPVARINEVIRYFYDTQKWKSKLADEFAPVNRSGLKHLHTAIEEVKIKISNEKVPAINSTQLFPAKIRTIDDDMVTRGWKSVKSMAQVLIEAWQYRYELPALQEFYGERDKLPRVSRPVTELSKDKIGRLLCYYCFSKLTRLYDREIVPEIVMTDNYECPKCKVVFK